jgi:DNA-binding transcriptional LysR family regulator
MLDWNDLKIVLALSRATTMSGAAKELRVDHTTIGRRLTAIEEALGVTLFQRTPRALVPTEAGTATINRALAIEKEMLELERQIKNQQKSLEGQVRITASDAFAAPIAHSLVGLKKLHPGIAVELVSSNEVLDLTKGEADLAVRLGDTPQQGLIVKKVIEAEVGVYASKSYVDVNCRANTPDQGHPLVVFDRRPIAEWPGWQRLNTHVVMRASSFNAVKTAVAAGLGIGPLPRFIAAEEKLEQVVPDTVMTVVISLVVHPDLKETPRIRAVIDYLSQYLRTHAKQLGGRPIGEAGG